MQENASCIETSVRAPRVLLSLEQLPSRGVYLSSESYSHRDPEIHVSARTFRRNSCTLMLAVLPSLIPRAGAIQNLQLLASSDENLQRVLCRETVAGSRSFGQSTEESTNLTNRNFQNFVAQKFLENFWILEFRNWKTVDGLWRFNAIRANFQNFSKFGNFRGVQEFQSLAT